MNPVRLTHCKKSSYESILHLIKLRPASSSSFISIRKDFACRVTDLPTPITCKSGGFEKKPRKTLRPGDFKNMRQYAILWWRGGSRAHRDTHGFLIHHEIKRQSRETVSRHPKPWVSRSNREGWKVWKRRRRVLVWTRNILKTEQALRKQWREDNHVISSNTNPMIVAF